MPTMTVPASLGSGRGVRESGGGTCMHPLYGCKKLHEHLAHLRFLHARLPDFVEEVQIAANDSWIVHVGNAVPAVRLQSIHQRLVVPDYERAGARRLLGPHA